MARPRLDTEKIPQEVLLRLVLHFAVDAQKSMQRGQDLAKAITHQGGKVKKSGDSWYVRFDDYGSLLSVSPSCLWDVCRIALAKFISYEFDGYHACFSPKEIELLVGELGIDIKKEWRVDEEFLELHTRDQLGKLATEWKVIAIGDKRSEAIKSLLNQDANTRLPCPKELLEQKHVRL